MQKSFSFLKDGGWLTITLATLVSVFFVMTAVNAATTITTSIDTGGTLTVTGASTLTGAITTAGAVTLGDASSDAIIVTGNASTTNALTVAGIFYVNGFATTTASNGNFATAGSLTVNGAATLGDASSDAIIITGNASTTNALTVAGIFYVNGFATTTASNGNFATEGTITGASTLTISGNTSLVQATSTYMAATTYATVTALTVSNDSAFNGGVTLGTEVADSVTANSYFTQLRIGTGNTFGDIGTVGADELGVEGAVEFDSTFNVAATSTLATTTVANLLAIGTTTPWQAHADLIVDGSGTTTIKLYSSNAAAGGCVEMRATDGTLVSISATSGVTTTNADRKVIWQLGACK